MFGAENKLKEIFGGQNTVYEVNDNSDFLLTGYKVLKNQNDSYFVRCSRFTFNGKIRLMYFTSDLRPLSNIVNSVDSNMFLQFISNLFSNIINMKANGFLMISNLELSADKIFIDTMTMSVKLLYFPIAFMNISEEKAEANLRMQIIDLINRSPNIYNSTVAAFSSELTNSARTITDLYNFLRTNNIVGVNTGTNIPKTNNVNSAMSIAQPEMYFSTINSIYSVNFVINKPEFTIGKNELMVDGAITFNGAISRKHCKIVYENRQYYIEDLESANGTFVNNYRVQPGTKQPLQRGDIIKLANSEFIVEF
ncbi:MAG: FHA domain-containing protein [Clostridiales bacterium]|nr:FHA domain-containing protein [Clostridiales bacterium]